MKTNKNTTSYEQEIEDIRREDRNVTRIFICLIKFACVILIPLVYMLCISFYYEILMKDTTANTHKSCEFIQRHVMITTLGGEVEGRVIVTPKEGNKVIPIAKSLSQTFHDMNMYLLFGECKDAEGNKYEYEPNQ